MGRIVLVLSVIDVLNVPLGTEDLSEFLDVNLLLAFHWYANEMCDKVCGVHVMLVHSKYFLSPDG